MIKIVGVELYSALGKWPSRKWNRTFVETLMYSALSSPGLWTDNSLHC